MRTDDQFLAAVHARTERLRRQRERRRHRRILAGAAAACLAAVVLLATRMPSLVGRTAEEWSVTGARASVFNDSRALGYAVIGIVAFLLGVAVSLLGVYLSRRRNREDDER